MGSFVKTTANKTSSKKDEVISFHFFPFVGLFSSNCSRQGWRGSRRGRMEEKWQNITRITITRRKVIIIQDIIVRRRVINLQLIIFVWIIWWTSITVFIKQKVWI